VLLAEVVRQDPLDPSPLLAPVGVRDLDLDGVQLVTLARPQPHDEHVDLAPLAAVVEGRLIDVEVPIVRPTHRQGGLHVGSGHRTIHRPYLASSIRGLVVIAR
jgi:hypothetical protein